MGYSVLGTTPWFSKYLKCVCRVLEGQHVIAAAIDNSGGDFLLTAHGVDGDDGSLQVQDFEKLRDGGNLVGFAIDRLLAQQQMVLTRPGADQMQRALAGSGVERASQGLAIDG